MAWVFGGKHYGQYTYEHWFDDDYDEFKSQEAVTMQKEVISLFVHYNESVNGAMNNIIKTLSPEEWNKPLGGFFPSVRSLCSHIYICDFNWLKRFKNVRQFTSLDDSFFDNSYSFKETLFEDMGEYLAKRPDMDSRMTAFADELTDADMVSVLTYTDSTGQSHKRNFGGTMLQFLNHETHHRGMISLYLEMLGRENDFSSLAQVLK
jgi:uncharacterized damage-inducible protein DinB